MSAARQPWLWDPHPEATEATDELAAIDDYLDHMRAPVERHVLRETRVEGLQMLDVRRLSRVERIDAMIDRARRYRGVMEDIEAELEMVMSENRALMQQIARYRR